MPKTTAPQRTRPRAVTAAARAAAKRAERADPPRAPRPDRPGRPRRQLPRPPRAARLPRRFVRLPLLALTALLLAGLAAVTLLGLRQQEAAQSREAGRAALSAAVEAAPVIFSYRHDELEENFAAARDHLTGPFLEEYRRTTETVVAPTAEEYEAEVTAVVAGGDEPAASVVSASPDEVVVLLFINQATESTQVTGERVDLNRVRMTLRHTAEGWQVSAVDAL